MIAFFGQNEHDRPVHSPETPLKRLFVHDAWRWGTSRMRMQPDSGELFRPPTGVDLTVEEIGNRIIIELDRYRSTVLLNQFDILDQQ